LLRIGGERETLRTILNDEVRRGRIAYHSTSRRYELNGAVEPELLAALRSLVALEAADRSRPAGGRRERGEADPGGGGASRPSLNREAWKWSR
jgi:hypothetical protein